LTAGELSIGLMPTFTRAAREVFHANRKLTCYPAAITMSKAETMEKTPPMSRAEARALIANCVLFRGLGALQRDEIVTRARVRSYAAGDTIFVMGSQHESMMAVVSGTVKISVPTADGREIVLAILQPDEVFGEIAMLDGKERSADAIAMTDCDLVVLERRDVMSFLERHPEAWPALVGVLCARLRDTDQHLVEVALLPLPVRLAKALLRAATQHDGGARVPLSQRELGNMVGATRERVNKCFHQWQRAGIVDVDRRAITILDRSALEALADQG
jgi:CRP/FNR family cyclic AMP-dependent transcriptional regulator